jgi:RES domain-containing protein
LVRFQRPAQEGPDGVRSSGSSGLRRTGRFDPPPHAAVFLATSPSTEQWREQAQHTDGRHTVRTRTQCAGARIDATTQAQISQRGARGRAHSQAHRCGCTHAASMQAQTSLGIAHMRTVQMCTRRADGWAQMSQTATLNPRPSRHYDRPLCYGGISVAGSVTDERSQTPYPPSADTGTPKAERVHASASLWDVVSW